MKAYIGAVVLICQPDGERLPGIVYELGSDWLNIHGFIKNGNISNFTSVRHADEVGPSQTGWAWPETGIVAGELVAGEGLAGGFNIGSLFGGFQSLIGPILISIYLANQAKIGEAADRALTPSETVVRMVCRSLGISHPVDVDKVIEAANAWGDKGGDLLETIAAARAGMLSTT